MRRPYRVYVKKNDKDSETLLWITRYLYSRDINIRGHQIINRLFPARVTAFPAVEISVDGAMMCGLTQIIDWYSQELDINNLLELADEFKKNNPEFKISTTF